jgi:hypothetical protein
MGFCDFALTANSLRTVAHADLLEGDDQRLRVDDPELLGDPEALATIVADRARMEIWLHTTSLLNMAANIAKLFWGSGRGQKMHRRHRAALRDAVDIDRKSPLANKDVRNKFEHLDEAFYGHIEEYEERLAADPKAGTVLMQYLIVPEAHMDLLPPAPTFGIWHPDTDIVRFGEVLLDLRALMAEIRRVRDNADRALRSQGHWL